MIQFQCVCGKMLQAKEEYAGLEITCPACSKATAIPSPTRHTPTEALRSTGTEYAISGAPLPVVAGAPPQRPASRGRQATELSLKALTALILGCLTFLLPVLAAIPAIVLALLALKDIGTGQGRLAGRGLALAGLILGVVGNISLWPGFLIYQNISEGREQRLSQLYLKQIGLAMHNYHDTNRAFPGAAIRSPDGRPLLSWRVAILPYIEEGPLFNQFRLDEPWDGPNNSRLLQQMPPIYAPVRGSTPQPFCTYYQVFTGPNTPFPDPAPFQNKFAPMFGGLRMMDFHDGTSNTILVVEAGEAVPWTKPADIVISPTQPLPRLGGMWRNGFSALLADGSVRHLDMRRVSEPTLRAAITPRGGEVLGPDWEGAEGR